MVNALIAAPPKSKAISEATQARMDAEYGDMLSDSAQLKDAAEKAVHSDKRGGLLMTELRMLSRRVNRQPTPVQAIKETSDRIINSQKVRDLRPAHYQRQEAKAARAAMEAVANGDYEQAFVEKQKQILNHYLYKAAKKAKEQADKDAGKMRDLGKSSAQKRLAKAGGEYLEQINSILERFEFKPVSLKKIDKRRSLEAWVLEREQDGDDIAIDPALFDEARTVNYKELTVEELNSVMEAVKHITHLARLKNQLLDVQDKRDIDEIAEELIDSALINEGDNYTLREDDNLKGFHEKLSDKLKGIDATLIKVEQIIDWLDGGRADGPWSKMFWNLFAKAEHKENDLSKKHLKVLAENFKNFGEDHDLMEKVVIPELGTDPKQNTVTKQWILTVALNVGNDSNYEKLLKGKDWSPATVEAILDHMTKEDWLFVTGVWRQLQSLWPDIVELEKKVRGIPPEPIGPRTVRTKYGDFEGGYFPVIYDSKRSTQGLKQNAEQSPLYEASLSKATTSKNHIQSRIDSFAAPMKLGDLSTITQHLSAVLHDLTHRTAIMNANRILSRSDVRDALQRSLGDEYYKLMKRWVNAIADDRVLSANDGLGPWMSLAKKLRMNATVVAMGFKMTTMMSQFAGFTNSMDMDTVPKLLLAKYVGRMSNPKTMVATTKYVMKRSGEMRHRIQQRDREVKDMMRSLTGKTDKVSRVKEMAFMGIGYADLYVAVPTWMAAYENAKNEGMKTSDAVNTADRAVRLSQGSGGMKDLAGVLQNNNETWKLTTMFYSYFSALYGRLRNAGHRVGSKDKFMRTVGRTFYLILLPAVLGELLAGRGPDNPDDEEEVARWLIHTVGTYPFAAVPWVRDGVNAVAPIITGEGRSFGYRYSPALAIYDKLQYFTSDVTDAISGEGDWSEAAEGAFELSGYIFGLPTAQAQITGGYIADVISGEEQPEDFGEFLHNMLYRRKK
jgi:hypothetical protein